VTYTNFLDSKLCMSPLAGAEA